MENHLSPASCSYSDNSLDPTFSMFVWVKSVLRPQKMHQTWQLLFIYTSTYS